MPDRSVAYVLKGYPRMSELFIASEIARLEQLGVRVRLYVLKARDEEQHHPVVDRIVATPTYLPVTSSLGAQPLWRWLRDNIAPFKGPIARVLRRHPLRLLIVTAMAMAQAIRARDGWRPRPIYIKELLLAIALADELADAPDVAHLHGHFAHGTTTVTWLCARLTGLPFSFTGHAKDIYQTSLNPAGLLARKMRAASFVVTCTAANRQHLQAVAPGVPVHIIYHGLNADFSPLAAAAGVHVPPPALRVISVGRLVPKKGFDVLIDAVALLVERGVELQLVIAGEDGDASRVVRERIVAAGLGDVVTWLGPLSQAELFAQYRESSVFALACRITDDGDRDGIPNVMMEAMAAGLPVVSTRVSGIPELVTDGINGLLVEPESAVALADALWRVAKDPALAERLAVAGRATIAERFDGEVLAARMAAMFGMSS
jgi:glycosyltransferase involved in cell wall biosynthesis